MDNRGIFELLDEEKAVGVIGSPSSTPALTIDILETAAASKLLGEMLLFNYKQDDIPHIGLGQVTEIELRNRWLETTSMRSLARRKGQVYPISAIQDVHIAKMNVGAVFAFNGKGFEQSGLCTVPPTGTEVKKVNNNILDVVLENYKDEIFYLGKIYGTQTRMPFWFKHFGEGKYGAGEAYHIGIFGKTGSGKSFLAKLLLTAYARHKEMSVIILDPQGEFSKDLSGGYASRRQWLQVGKIIKDVYDRKVYVLPLKKLILDQWEIFSQLLFNSAFFEKLSVSKGENRRIACDVLIEKLRKSKIRLVDLYEEETFEKALTIISDEKNLRTIYRSEEARERLKRALQDADKDELLKIWKGIAYLFSEKREGARRIDGLLRWAFESKAIVSIDLSEESAGEEIYWDSNIQMLVIKRLLQIIQREAEYAYKKGEFLNTLVILDEAHRLVPKDKPEEEEHRNVRNTLLDAVRTTRKYGLGWMFISQTISSLHREIINQMRIIFIGYGLSMGSEFFALKEIVGGDPQILGLYQSFRDPHSAFDPDNREYPFMSVGPVSPLSFSGTPLFFNVFTDGQEFTEANNLKLQSTLF